MARLILCAFFAMLMVSSVQGCGFLDIVCKIKEDINDVASKLIGQALQAFEQAMDHLFDQDISPLLNKVEAAIDAGIDKVNQDVNETINHVESSVEAIIEDAAQTANSLASNLTHDIEQIISKAATALLKVENTFYQDASNLLAQINEIVQKGQCMEAGGAKQIQDQIYKLLKSLNPYYRFSSCWHSLGYKITMSLEDLTDIQLYNYQKECTLLNKITPSTPVDGPGGILQTYAQGQLYAAEYYCIGETANAPAFQDVLMKEWLWWGVQYNAWKKIGKRSKNNTRHTSENSLKDDPSCGTPIECYAKAIEALKEAEEKIIDLQTGLASLNHTVVANQMQAVTNQKNVNASIQRLQANVSANSQAISSNKKEIADNSNSIDSSNSEINSNSQALASMQVFPCNCQILDEKSSGCDSSTLSQGFNYYCDGTSCKSSSGPIMDNDSGTGIACCELCTGTSEEAEAYAREHARPPSVRKECNAALETDRLQPSVL